MGLRASDHLGSEETDISPQNIIFISLLLLFVQPDSLRFDIEKHNTTSGCQDMRIF